MDMGAEKLLEQVGSTEGTTGITSMAVTLQHFFKKHLLRTYYAQGIVGAKDTVANKIGKVWILRELTVGKEDRW